jgi:hypothetical protein
MTPAKAAGVATWLATDIAGPADDVALAAVQMKSASAGELEMRQRELAARSAAVRSADDAYRGRQRTASGGRGEKLVASTGSSLQADGK